MIPLPPAGPVRSRNALALALHGRRARSPSCDSSTSTDPLSPNTATTAVSQVAEAKATVKVLATGLKFPRGFTFGANGAVYVAEAGLGGTHTTTTKQCDQVIPPVGPYTNGPTARISRIGLERQPQYGRVRLPVGHQCTGRRGRGRGRGLRGRPALRARGRRRMLARHP